MNKNITTLRQKIDAVDQSIIKTLARRLRLSQAIGEEKKKSAVAVTDRIREQQMQEARRALSEHLDIDPQWIERIFRLIVRKSRTIQKHL